MATLDNFHTGNRPTPLHPHLPARWAQVRLGLHNNKDWDAATHTPVAPAATYNPAERATAHPSPQIEERLTVRSMKDHLVPLRPYTHQTHGDTAGGVLLYQDHVAGRAHGSSWLNRLIGRRAAVPQFSRFHPYQR